MSRARNKDATRSVIMEFPTLDQLQILLQKDKAFRDYLNTFLNLPVKKLIKVNCLFCLLVDILQVFCRRFTYDAEIKKFEGDPLLQSPSHVRNQPVLHEQDNNYYKLLAVCYR